MNVQLLSPEQVADNWPLLKSFLLPAFEHGVGESTPMDYLKRALNYQAQVWVVMNDSGEVVSTALTQFLDYSTHRTLHIVVLGGSRLEEWIEHYSVLEEFAKKNNCKAVEQWGRPGWSKVLPKLIPGFEVVYHVMRKEIT